AVCSCLCSYPDCSCRSDCSGRSLAVVLGNDCRHAAALPDEERSDFLDDSRASPPVGSGSQDDLADGPPAVHLLAPCSADWDFVGMPPADFPVHVMAAPVLYSASPKADYFRASCWDAAAPAPVDAAVPVPAGAAAPVPAQGDCLGAEPACSQAVLLGSQVALLGS